MVLEWWKDVEAILTEMIDNNVALDVQTSNVLIDMLCEEGRVDEARAILELMINRSRPPNIIAYTALLDGYFYVAKWMRQWS